MGLKFIHVSKRDSTLSEWWKQFDNLSVDLTLYTAPHKKI